MVRSQYFKDTTTQHSTTHMHGCKKHSKNLKVYHGMHVCWNIYLKLQKNTSRITPPCEKGSYNYSSKNHENGGVDKCNICK